MAEEKFPPVTMIESGRHRTVVNSKPVIVTSSKATVTSQSSVKSSATAQEESALRKHIRNLANQYPDSAEQTEIKTSLGMFSDDFDSKETELIGLRKKLANAADPVALHALYLCFVARSKEYSVEHARSFVRKLLIEYLHKCLKMHEFLAKASVYQTEMNQLRTLLLDTSKEKLDRYVEEYLDIVQSSA